MRLKEVCQITNVSRRAIQGYEKAGLVTPCGKNERGYLLYDEQAIEQILKIRFYQDIGMSIKEIVSVSDAPSEVLKKKLEEQITKMDLDIKKKEELILQTQRLIDNL